MTRALPGIAYEDLDRAACHLAEDVGRACPGLLRWRSMKRMGKLSLRLPRSAHGIVVLPRAAVETAPGLVVWLLAAKGLGSLAPQIT